MPIRPRWVACLVICAAILMSLLIVATDRARTTSRMMASSNNLKQLALGAHIYHDTYDRLPPGTLGQTMADAKHGHLLRLLPYIEATIIYASVDFDFPWDHKLNRCWFRSQVHTYARPGVDRQFTTEGYSLTHYMANPRLIHRQSDVSLHALEDPGEVLWLFGEVSGRFVPWGSPFAWRELSWPLGGNSGGYGGWPRGTQFAMLDGSVRLVGTHVDREIVEQMARAGPDVDESLIQVPDRRFQDDGQPPRAAQYYPSDAERSFRSKARWGTHVYFDAGGAAETIRVATSITGPGSTGIDLAVLVERYSEARVLLLRGLPLVDPVAESISRLRDLEVLAVDDWSLSPAGIDALASLPRLEAIYVPRQAVSDETREELAKQLTAVRFRRR